MSRYIVAIAAVVLAVPVWADGLSYSYLQGGYQRVELDDSLFDVDGDGFGFGGSYDFGNNVFAFAGYSMADFDFGVDVDELDVGVGYHIGVGERTDFVTTIAYVSVEADVGGFGSFDDSGIGASVGLRSMLTDRFELSGSLNYVDLDESGDDTSVSGAVWYDVSDVVALGANLAFGDDTTTYGLGARFYFGN